MTKKSQQGCVKGCVKGCGKCIKWVTVASFKVLKFIICAPFKVCWCCAKCGLKILTGGII